MGRRFGNRCKRDIKKSLRSKCGGRCGGGCGGWRRYSLLHVRVSKVPQRKLPSSLASILKFEINFFRCLFGAVGLTARVLMATKVLEGTNIAGGKCCVAIGDALVLDDFWVQRGRVTCPRANPSFIGIAR